MLQISPSYTSSWSKRQQQAVQLQTGQANHRLGVQRGTYYFAENGEHVWGDVSQWVADEGKKLGYFKMSDVKSLNAEEADAKRRFGQGLWGGNSRGRAVRAREVLGWKPSGAPFRDEVKAALEAEAQALGLKAGHAEVAAGDR